MLRILLDEGISRAVARDLRASGYTVEHALDLNLKGQPDPIIFQAAQQRAAAGSGGLLSQSRRLPAACCRVDDLGAGIARRADYPSSGPSTKPCRDYPIAARALR